MCVSMPKWFKLSKLRIFGEVGIVTDKNKILNKLEDHGFLH